MTIKMLMGEQFQPLGAPIKRKEPEKPDPIAAFERGNHAGPGGGVVFGRVRADVCMSYAIDAELPKWMVDAAVRAAVRRYTDSFLWQSVGSELMSPATLVDEMRERLMKLTRNQAGSLGVTCK